MADSHLALYDFLEQEPEKQHPARAIHTSTFATDTLSQIFGERGLPALEITGEAAFGGQYNPETHTVLIPEGKGEGAYYHELGHGIYEQYFGEGAEAPEEIRYLPFMGRVESAPVDPSWHAISGPGRTGEIAAESLGRALQALRTEDPRGTAFGMQAEGFPVLPALEVLQTLLGRTNG